LQWNFHKQSCDGVQLDPCGKDFFGLIAASVWGASQGTASVWGASSGAARLVIACQWEEILDTDLCGIQGVGRFYVGLADQIEIVEGEELKEYARKWA
jgi:hypothetical protein